MHLSQFLKYYVINIKSLDEVLKKNGIVVKLRLIKNVPIEWHQIISQHTNIPISEQIKEINAGSNQKKKNEIEQNSLYHKTSSKEQDNNTREKTGYQTECGTKSKKNTDNNIFLAYVKFIAPSCDHGFVKRITGRKEIPSKAYSLNKRDDNDLKIYEGCEDVRVGQFIICKLKKRRRNSVEIVSQTFEGSLFANKFKTTFIAWVSLNSPLFAFDISLNNPQIEGSSIYSVELYLERRGLSCMLLDKLVDETIIRTKIENYLQGLLLVETYDEYDLAVLEWAKSSKEFPEYLKHMEVQFENELTEAIQHQTRKELESFFNKWMVLNPEIFKTKKIAQLNKQNLFFPLWFLSKLDSDLWDVELIHVVTHICNTDKDNKLESIYVKQRRLHVQANNEEIIVNGIKEYLNDPIKIIDKNTFDEIQNLIEFLPKDDREESRKLLKSKLLPAVHNVLWKEGKVNTFMVKEAMREFPSLSFNLQKRIFKSVNDTHKITLLKKSIEELDRNIEDAEIFFQLQTFIGFLPEENKLEYTNLVGEYLLPELHLSLWKDGILESFPKLEVISDFENYDADLQKRIINKLGDQEVITVLDKIKDHEDIEIIARLEKIITALIFEKFNPVSFDIESDKKSISEIAWGSNDNWSNFADKAEIDKALELFKIETKDNSKTFIGHNIIGFDCVILEDYKVKINQEQVWDTFLVEMILSHELNNFALKTAHHAIEDAKLTYDLFINQVFRILKMPLSKLTYLLNYLPVSIGQKIIYLQNANLLSWGSDSELNLKRESFYRPQQKTSPIIMELSDKLSQSTAKTKVIIGPHLYINEVIRIPNILLIGNQQDSYKFHLIDVEKVESIDERYLWEKNVLLSFIQNCSIYNTKAYIGNLAPAVFNKVKESVDIDSFLIEEEKINCSESQTLFMLANQLVDLPVDLEEIELFILEPDLITISNKIFIGDIDIEALFLGANKNQFWMNFSGGQSYIKYSKKDVELLGIETDEQLNNFWIEKYKYNKYKLWGNINWEQALEAIPVINTVVLNTNKEQFYKKQTHFSVITSKRGSNTIIRLNPETIYRSRYWVVQKELLSQVGNSKNPIIYLIQRWEEIEEIENYFRVLGYFIPNRDIALSRRLELIHLYKGSRKIIIDVPENIGGIIKSNYLGALEIVLDSFNLGENYYITENTSFFKAAEVISMDTENKIDPSLMDKNRPLEQDHFFLLKLQLPLINYMRSIFKTYDEGHRLWLLDPRISDFPGLGESWNASRRYMTIWTDIKQYDIDAKEADKHIKGIIPMEKLPFSILETKKMLAKVFLPKNKYWYPEQEEFLDVILEGKDDQLVSLPTGAGKSLLFQAPALFRSSFTNRLTIVITPLKALMEDQVKALWKKGFHGSVEYINSDRGTDIQMIYRSIAGGELFLIFITPERLRTNGFLTALNMRLQTDGGLEYGVFDEAHCVSQWGHEFRPDYLNSAKVIHNMRLQTEHRFPVLLFSATVSEKIYKDLNFIFS